MAKRFIDTGMFDDPWFMDLNPELKCYWIYALTKCDHAGILTLNKVLAKIQIGVDSIEPIIEQMSNKICHLEGDKYIIPSFIEFQYGVLKPENRVHASVIDILNKYKNKPLISPLLGAKDKDKDKDKEKEVYSEEKRYSFDESKETPSNEEIKNIDVKYNEVNLLEDWTKCRKHFLSQPTGIKKLTHYEQTYFRNAMKIYDVEEIKEAMKCHFMQENKTIKSMYLRPSHFLEHIDKYHTAAVAKEYQLYGSNKVKTAL